MLRRLLCRLGFHGHGRVWLKRTGWHPVFRPRMGIRAVNAYAPECPHCGYRHKWWLPDYRVEEWISGGPDGTA